MNNGFNGWPSASAAQAALDARYWAAGRLASGFYYWPFAGSSSSTSATLGNGNLRAVPWLVPNSCTLSRLGAEVVTGTSGDSGCKLRLGIYADNGSGQPGNLVLDAGTIAGDSIAVQEITILQRLDPGLYWLAGAVQLVSVTQPTIRTAAVVPPAFNTPAGTSAPTAGAGNYGWFMSGVTGVLPQAFTISGASSSTPRYFVKVA